MNSVSRQTCYSYRIQKTYLLFLVSMSFVLIFILRHGHTRSSSLMLVDFKCLWDLHQTVMWLQDCAICCEVCWENAVFAGTVYLESADNQFVQVTLPLSGYLKTSSFWCQNSNTFLFVTNRPKLDELENIDLTKYKVFQAKICLLLQFKISDIVFVFSLITAGLTIRNGHTKNNVLQNQECYDRSNVWKAFVEAHPMVGGHISYFQFWEVHFKNRWKMLNQMYPSTFGCTWSKL